MIPISVFERDNLNWRRLRHLSTWARASIRRRFPWTLGIATLRTSRSAAEGNRPRIEVYDKNERPPTLSAGVESSSRTKASAPDSLVVLLRANLTCADWRARVCRADLLAELYCGPRLTVEPPRSWTKQI